MILNETMAYVITSPLPNDYKKSFFMNESW